MVVTTITSIHGNPERTNFENRWIILWLLRCARSEYEISARHLNVGCGRCVCGLHKGSPPNQPLNVTGAAAMRCCFCQIQFLQHDIKTLPSGMTQEQIGVKMGLAEKDARKAVSRLLNPAIRYDPRLSTLLSFASAIDRQLKEIL
jgi:hypothetical protein